MTFGQDKVLALQQFSLTDMKAEFLHYASAYHDVFHDIVFFAAQRKIGPVNVRFLLIKFIKLFRPLKILNSKLLKYHLIKVIMPVLA